MSSHFQIPQESGLVLFLWFLRALPKCPHSCSWFMIPNQTKVIRVLVHNPKTFSQKLRPWLDVMGISWYRKGEMNLQPLLDSPTFTPKAPAPPQIHGFSGHFHALSHCIHQEAVFASYSLYSSLFTGPVHNPGCFAVDMWMGVSWDVLKCKLHTKCWRVSTKKKNIKHPTNKCSKLTTCWNGILDTLD